MKSIAALLFFLLAATPVQAASLEETQAAMEAGDFATNIITNFERVYQHLRVRPRL